MADKKENRVFKPRKERVTLNERMLPDVKDLTVGEETTIEIKVKVVAISEGSEYGSIDSEDGDWESEHYGEKYAAAKRKEDSLKRATFVVLSAEEDTDADESPEQKAANKIMAEKRRKRVI